MSSKKKQDTYKYKMTFVMPVYNAEAYLHETLDCIIGQTLGFKDNIQIVIVNDGSRDDSGKVAKRYQKKHPKNIIYIEQENAGVSAARNAGIEKVEGKYISFLDSDDLLSADTAQSVYDFFEEHYSEIDLVTIQLRFFGVKTGSHPLNYKYKKDEVVYTQDKYTYSQLSGGSAFVKTDAVKSVLKFDTKIKRSEDFKFLTQLILEKQAYGVLKKPIYWYRKAEAADGKQADQAEMNNIVMNKMIKFMPIMMFFIMVSIPGTIALYYGTSNIIAVLQQTYLLRKDADEMDEIAGPINTEKTKKTHKKATQKAQDKVAAKETNNIVHIKAKSKRR